MKNSEVNGRASCARPECTSPAYRGNNARSLNLHDRRAEPPLIRSGRVARVGRTEWSQALTYPQTWSLRSNIGTASEHPGLPSLP